MCKLSNIERICGAAPGGLANKIEIICLEDVHQFPKTWCSTIIASDIILNADAKAYTINIANQSGLFTEKTITNNPAGDYYEQKLTFTIKKERDQLSEFISNSINNMFHVIFTDKSGVRKLIPCMKFSFQYSSGKKSSDGNAYSNTLISKNINKAYIFKGAIN